MLIKFPECLIESHNALKFGFVALSGVRSKNLLKLLFANFLMGN